MTQYADVGPATTPQSMRATTSYYARSLRAANAAGKKRSRGEISRAPPTGTRLVVAKWRIFRPNARLVPFCCGARLFLAGREGISTTASLEASSARATSLCSLSLLPLDLTGESPGPYLKNIRSLPMSSAFAVALEVTSSSRNSLTKDNEGTFARLKLAVASLAPYILLVSPSACLSVSCTRCAAVDVRACVCGHCCSIAYLLGSAAEIAGNFIMIMIVWSKNRFCARGSFFFHFATCRFLSLA